MKFILNIFLVTAIIYVIPIIIYGIGQSLVTLQMPEDVSPQTFLISVLISKLGTALAFVLIFYFARSTFNNNWHIYAGIWFAMFAIGELGQTILPSYTWNEALAGIISEAIYFPLSAYIVNWLLKK